MQNVQINGLPRVGRGPNRTALWIVACLFGVAQAALGQQAPNSGADALGAGALDEIIVTAQRREEKLIDVPLFVTAVTGQEIDARGITDLQEMQYAVPGLTMAETGPGQGRIQLDGVGATGGSTGSPTVGEYLDEMPVTNVNGGQAIDIRLLDMQRVEVLHGPQATLYGEGSMGGTIHFVTASPDLNRFGTSIDGNWGSVTDGSSSYRGAAVLNAPLIANVLGLRIVGGYEHDAGWINSLVTGQNNINGVDFTTFRAKLLYQPVEDLSISLMYLHQTQTQGYQNFGMPDRTTASAYPTYNNETYNLGNLITSYNFGPVTLVNTAGFLHRQPEMATDFTAFFLPYLPLLGLPPSVVANISTIGYPNLSTQNASSDELRLSSNPGGRLNYVVGVYYRDYRVSFDDFTVTLPGTLPFELLDEVGSSRSESWAAYAEVRYSFTSELQALAALRHYHDEEFLTQTATGAFDTPGTNTSTGTFESNNPRFNISYKTPGLGLIYVEVAKGFRSGQFNLGATPPTPASAGPESLWTYTVGTNQEWFERRLSMELSAYYNNWSNIQTLGIAPTGAPLGYYTNVGKASGPGVNFAILGRPIPDLKLSATVGFTDMKYDTNEAETHEGDPVDLVSRWTYSTSAEYLHPLTATIKLMSRIDFQHTDGYQLTIRDYPGPQQVFPTDKRNILNARVGLDFGKYQAFVYGNNLTDNNGTIYPAVGSFPEPVLPTPRTVGVEAKVEF